jgi:hypothetical protein
MSYIVCVIVQVCIGYYLTIADNASVSPKLIWFHFEILFAKCIILLLLVLLYIRTLVNDKKLILVLFVLLLVKLNVMINDIIDNVQSWSVPQVECNSGSIRYVNVVTTTEETVTVTVTYTGTIY